MIAALLILFAVSPVATGLHSCASILHQDGTVLATETASHSPASTAGFIAGVQQLTGSCSLPGVDVVLGIGESNTACHSAHAAGQLPAAAKPMAGRPAFISRNIGTIENRTALNDDRTADGMSVSPFANPPAYAVKPDDALTAPPPRIAQRTVEPINKARRHRA